MTRALQIIIYHIKNQIPSKQERGQPNYAKYTLLCKGVASVVASQLIFYTLINFLCCISENIHIQVQCSNEWLYCECNVICLSCYKKAFIFSFSYINIEEKEMSWVKKLMKCFSVFYWISVCLTS